MAPHVPELNLAQIREKPSGEALAGGDALRPRVTEHGKRAGSQAAGDSFVSGTSGGFAGHTSPLRTVRGGEYRLQVSPHWILGLWA